MLFNLGLFTLLCLVVLLPDQAHSSSRRARFFTAHHPHGHHRAHPLKASTPPIQMLNTASREKHFQAAHHKFNNIAMVTTPHHRVQELGAMLDTPVSGPNPGGNSATLGNMLDTPVSGPNPGGNSQVLTASSGSNSQIFAASSGPNPGGNSGILAASSGPNPGDNSKSLTASDGHVFSSDAGYLFSADGASIGERDIVILSAVSGPNPGGNSATLTSRKFDGSKAATSKEFVRSRTSTGSNMSEKAETWQARGTTFSELPRAPVPPSGPSPSHNTVVTNQGLFAERRLRGVVGCEQDGEGVSAAGGRFHHLEAYTNTMNSMGAAILTSS